MALGYAGIGFIWLGLALCLLAAVLSIFGKKGRTWLNLGLACSGGAFLTLLALFLTDQFQFEYVFGHGKADYEVWYKIAGVWSGQEGSILLWSVMSGLFVWLVGRRTGEYERGYVIVAGLIHAMLAGILAFESPFSFIQVPPEVSASLVMPPDGRGMAPSLLNYWMVIHPPTIFSGFGSLTALFALSCAAAIRRDLDGWLDVLRPWAILSLSLLGLGLCMGGFWAYETLGWGGFWAWDPVENTSFVPWCAVAALVHGIFVQKARGSMKLTNLFLGGLPFLLFCYGTFLTRSGFLGDTSVHSFAEMDSTALWFLIGMGGISIAGFTALYIRAARGLKSSEGKKPERAFWNKDAFYRSAAWLLAGFGLVTAIGMSVPLIQSLSGQAPKVVEEAIYHQILGWLFIPTMLAIGIAPHLNWRGLTTKEAWIRISNALAFALLITALMLWWVKSGWMSLPADFEATTTLSGGIQVNTVFWALLLFFLCAFAFLSNLYKLIELMPKNKRGIGGVATHIGIAVAMAGLIFSRALEQKEVITLRSDQPTVALGQTFEADGATRSLVDRDNKVKVQTAGPLGDFTLWPGLYYEPSETDLNSVVWPGIARRGFYDVYFALREIVWEATDPVSMEVEESFTFDGMLLTYKGMTREGEAGVSGTKFFANVTIEDAEGTRDVTPGIELNEGQVRTLPAEANSSFRLVLERIDAGTNGAVFRFDYRQPAYPVEVFYKPLTLLVWIGVGIMFLGGLVAAFARKKGRERPRDIPT